MRITALNKEPINLSPNLAREKDLSGDLINLLGRINLNRRRGLDLDKNCVLLLKKL